MKTAFLSCLLLSSSAVLAQTANTFLPAGGSYGVATNWSLGHVPDSNDVAVISVTNSATATNSAGTFAAGSLLMGASGRTGNLVVTGGELSYAAASTVATNGAIANLINSGGTLIFSNNLTLATSTGTATYASLTNNSGTVRVEGTLQVGIHGGAGAGARGLLTVNGGTVTVTGNLATCNATAFSYIRLNGGTLEVAGVTHGGSATERVLFFNGGTLRALRDNAAFLPVAANAVQMTNSVLNGGAVIDSQGFAITVATPFLQAAGQTGGLTKVGAGLLDLTANSIFTGATRVAAGTLKLSGSGSLYNNGTLAGQVRVEPGATLWLARTDVFGNHVSASPVGLNIPTNALVVNSNSFTTLRDVALRGGELRALGGANALYGSYQLKGTITATGDATSLISAPGTVNNLVFIQLGNNAAGGETTFQVADGAAAVDLQVEAPLADGRNAAGSATVPSGFIKSGAGTMRLTSNSTFTGTASVNAGVLVLGGNATVTGTLVVAGGAVLDVTEKTSLTVGAGQTLRGSGVVTGNVTAADGARVQGGGMGTPGTLTIAGNLTLGGSYTNEFDLTNSLAVGGGVNDLLVVNGNLDGGLSLFRINQLAPLANGTYRLIEYTGAETLPFTAAVVGHNTRDGLTILDDGTGVVELAVAAGTPQDLRWNPVFDGNWNLGTSNWVDQATGTVTDRFYDTDTVLFDDAGAFGATVTVATAVRPAGLVIHSSSNYIFQGVGRIQDRIGGATVLVKDGPGTLTVANTNDFTGGTLVSNGTLAVASGAGFGSGPMTLVNGALAAAGGPQTLANPVVLSGASGLLAGGPATLTVAGVVSGPGVLVKAGPDAVALTGANTITNGVVVRAGTLYGGAANAFGTAGTITLGDAGSDTNDITLLLRHAVDITRPVVVTPNGSGAVRIGKANESGAADGTTFGGGLTLQGRNVTIVHAGNDRTDFGGQLTGTGDVVVVNSDGGSGRVSWEVLSSNWTGNIIITGALARLQTFIIGNSINDQSDVAIWGPGAALWVYRDEAVDAIAGDGSILPFAANSTLIMGAGGGSGTFSGTVSNNGANSIRIIKAGAGTQTLGGPTVYSGDTEVWGGTLVFGPGSTISSSSVFVVSNGAVLDVASPGLVLLTNRTLRGGGAVTGAVIATGTARLVPGTGGAGGTRETLTLRGDVGLHAGSTNFFNLGATTNAGGGFNDLVVVGGNLEPSNSVIQIEVDAPPATGTYRLFDYAGAMTTTFDPTPRLSGLALGRKGAALDQSVPNQVNLVVTGAYADLVWLPQTNASWNYVDANWSNTASAVLETFLAGDAVTFDERGAYSNAVNLLSTNTPALVRVVGASNYIFQGAGRLQGVAELIKDGVGTLLLATTNTFTGPVTISGGVLRVGHSSALGTAAGTTTVRPGGTLDINGVNLSTEPVIAEGGSVLNHGPAQTVAFTDFRVTGDTLIGGTNRWDVRGTTARTLVAGGVTLTKAAGGEIVYLGVDGLLTNDGMIAVSQGRVGVWNTAIRGTGSFSVAAGALLALESATINSQAVTLAGGGLGTPTGTTLAQQNGPVLLTADSLLVATAGPFAVNGVISDAGGARSLTKSGGSIVYLSASNTYQGGTTLAGGNLYLQNAYGLGTGNVVITSGSLDFQPSNGATMVVANDIALPAVGTGEFWVRGSPSQFTTVRLTGRLSGGTAGQQYTFPDTGVGGNHFGVLVLENPANTFAGNLLMNRGSLVLPSDAVLGNVARIRHDTWNTNGQLRFDADGIVLHASRTLELVTGGQIMPVHVQTNTATIAGAVTGPGTLYKLGEGSLVLTGTNDWSGGARITVGTLQVGAGGTGGGLGAGAVSNMGALVINRSGTLSVPGAISGTGALYKAGGGTVVLHGVSTYVGPTWLQAGRLEVNGPHSGGGDYAVQSGATLGGTGAVSARVVVQGAATVWPGAAGAPGALRVGQADLADGARLTVLAGGTGSVLRVTGTNGLTLPTGVGTVTVEVANGLLAVGSYTVVDYAGTLQGGGVTNLVLGALPPRSSMYLTNNEANTSIDLVVVTAGEAIKWLGNTDGNWGIDAPTNWLTVVGLAATAYLQPAAVGDAVLFDDTAAGHFSLALLTNVAPASVTASNEVNDYAITGGPFGIGGATALRKLGAATLTLAGTNTYAGGTLVAGGTLQLGAGGALGAAGVAAITNAGTLLYSNSDVAVVANVLSGTGRVVKTGAGTVTQTGTNTYSGGTLVRGGTLVLAGTQTAYGNQTYSIASGAVLRIDVTTGTANYNTATYVGTGTLVKSGPGAVFWGAQVANVALQPGALIDVWEGQLDAGSSANDVWVNNRSSLNVSNGASITELAYLPSVFDALTGGGSVQLHAGAGAGPHTFTIGINGTAEGRYNAAGFATFGGVISQGGTLVKTGAGTQEFTGTNTYTGSTTVEGGVLRIADAGKLYHGAYNGTAVLTVRSNAVLDLATWSYSELGAEPLGGLRANDNAIVIDGGVIRIRKTTSYYRGFTVGAAGARLEPASNVVWTIPYTSTAAIVSSSGGTLVLAGYGTGVLNKIFPGAGGLVKDGAGRWVLGATNTYGGTTIVSNGTLVLQGMTGTNVVWVETNAVLAGDGVVKGHLNQNGTVSPGAGLGTLTVSGQVACALSAVTRIELGGTNALTEFDRLVSGDIHSLAGELQVALTNGFTPAAGDSFRVLENTAGLLLNEFTATNLPALGGGLGWEVQYAADSVTLVVTGTVYTPTPYEVWAQSIPNPALRGDQEDADGDGQVNLWEYSQGSDPTNSGSVARLQWYRTNGMAILRFNRATGAVDVVYEVEASYGFTNPAPWEVIASNVFGSGWSGDASVTETNSGAVRQVLTEDNDPASTRRGMRLRVTRP